MKKLGLFALAMLFMIAGCQDLRKDQLRPESQMTAPSLSVSGDADAPTGRSTVCLAYDSELARLQAELEQKPGDAELEASVTTFETLTSYHCK